MATEECTKLLTETKLLLAIDPSISSSGLAVFCEGLLVKTGRVKNKKPKAEKQTNIAMRCQTMVREIFDWYVDVAFDYSRPVQIPGVVFEWPQIYRLTKSKGDPNDLPAIAAIGLAVGMSLESRVLSFKPAEWAGQLKKCTSGDVSHSPRAIRIRSRLSEDEMKHWQNQHDIIDAIGIGLYGLGRFQPLRVFPGSS